MHTCMHASQFLLAYSQDLGRRTHICMHKHVHMRRLLDYAKDVWDENWNGMVNSGSSVQGTKDKRRARCDRKQRRVKFVIRLMLWALFVSSFFLMEMVECVCVSVCVCVCIYIYIYIYMHSLGLLRRVMGNKGEARDVYLEINTCIRIHRVCM